MPAVDEPGEPPKSSSPSLPSPLCSDPTPLQPHPCCFLTPQLTWVVGPLRVPPQTQQDPTSSEYPQGDIQDKRLFQRQGGASCSGIAGSCRIKEASKIAALNYIPANESHTNNGHCTRSPAMGVCYSSLRGWGPQGGMCHRGDRTEAATTALAGSDDDGDIGELVLTGKILYSCSQGRVRR